MCGLIQSIFVSVPVIAIRLDISNMADGEWCAHRETVAKRLASASRTPQIFRVTVILLQKLRSSLSQWLFTHPRMENDGWLLHSRQSLQKSLSPSAWSISGGLLIGLLVGFREEAHVQVIRCRIFTHRDPEFYGPIALTFIDRSR